jgi:5'-nucleotidase
MKKNGLIPFIFLTVSGEGLSCHTSPANIDLIVGGHTHTFFDNLLVYKNKNNNDVIVNQAGWAGIVLGRPDFEFSGFSGKKLAKSHTITVIKKTSQ